MEIYTFKGWRTEKDMNDVNGFNGFAGLRQRAALTQAGHKTTFVGPVYLDLACQVRR